MPPSPLSGCCQLPHFTLSLKKPECLGALGTPVGHLAQIIFSGRDLKRKKKKSGGVLGFLDLGPETERGRPGAAGENVPTGRHRIGMLRGSWVIKFSVGSPHADAEQATSGAAAVSSRRGASALPPDEPISRAS